VSELTDTTLELTASFDAFNRVIGERVLPAIKGLERELRAWYNSWPGMPYTAPSTWDASQMAAA
jgi:hypothetical protein